METQETIDLAVGFSEGRIGLAQGRNRGSRMAGVRVLRWTPGNSVIVQPMNTRGQITQGCMLEIPREEVRKVAEAMLKAADDYLPVLVTVDGGVAYEHDSPGTYTRIVDRDDLRAGGDPVELPAGVGFEALVSDAGLMISEEGDVVFVAPEGCGKGN